MEITSKDTRTVPVWAGVASLVMLPIIAYGFARRRGWALAVLAAVIYGVPILATLVNPGFLGRLHQQHSAADAAYLAPLLFLVLAFTTGWSLWWCLLTAVAGGAILVGLVLVRRRA